MYKVLVRVSDFPSNPLELFRSEFLASNNKFFLESSLIKPGFSRFSFMGCSYGEMSELITYKCSTKEVTIEKNASKQVTSVDSIFNFLQAKLDEKKIDCLEDLPFSFNLGYVGFLGYELKAETIGSGAWNSETHDAAFIFATRLIALDHEEKKSYLLYFLQENELEFEANSWFDALEHKIEKLNESGLNKSPVKIIPASKNSLSLDDVQEWIEKNATIRHKKEEYIKNISEALKKIVDGESYEICLTNLIGFPFEHSPFDLYCVMRELTPAPHAAYFNINDFHIASASPERYLSVDKHGVAEAKPIKGTRPRDANVALDLAYVKDLQTNPKDLAENLMIVDLLRNDLGQVCRIGSVEVPKLFGVETYSHVHQLVSTIRGKLKSNISSIEAVRALFPGGSMTGAPKKRTMEIIDALEKGPREAYSGVLGWFGLSGACDLNILIRSVTIDKQYAKFGVGGAIIALSDPEEEFLETMLKARGIVEAIQYLQNANIKKVVILGACGSIGKFLSVKCAAKFSDVIGIDLIEPRDPDGLGKTRFRNEDILNPSDLTISDLQSADVVIFAVSQELITASLPKINHYLNPHCLIVETTSTKTAFAEFLKENPIRQQLLGINPMFSGDLDPHNRPVAAVVFKDGILLEKFLNFLEELSLKVAKVDPYEHDKTMAAFQSLTHIVTLGFGELLSSLHIDPSMIEMLAPPPFQVLLSLLGRMTQNHPDTYWEIQSKNPYAQEIREKLLVKMHELHLIISEEKKEEFEDKFNQLRSLFIEKNPFDSEKQKQIFEFLRASYKKLANLNKTEVEV